MKIAKRQKIFMLVFFIVISVGVLYVVAKTYLDPGLPFGVNDEKFVDYLEEGKYKEADEYWDQTLEDYSEKDDQKKINDRFNQYLKNHLQYMDLYCSNSGFSVGEFNARYGGIEVLGDHVKDYLLISASKSVTRYANLNLSYTHARTVITMLCDMAKDETSKSAMLAALDAYRDIIEQYEKADEHLQMQNYIGAIQILSVICENIDEDLYLYYIAACSLDNAIEAVKVEADEYAIDRDYAKSAALLQTLCSMTTDEESHKMLKRVQNILQPGY